MVVLILVVCVLLTVSFLCSMLEAVLLSVRYPYIQSLQDRKSRAGSLLLRFKEQIEEPISAILTLNTISHTIGAAVSGAMALQLFGSKWIALFSACLTFLVLICSEIIPKTLGAHYWKTLSPFAAYLLQGMVVGMKPILIPIRSLTGLLRGKDSEAGISKTDIINTIRIGYFQGVIQPSEFEIMHNLFQLQSIKVRDVMTPRTVVFWLSPDQTVEEILGQQERFYFSRIPLYNVDKDAVEGVVLRRDIMSQIAQKKTDLQVKTMARPPVFVPEKISVYKLLNQLIATKTHLAVVLDEYGGFIGVVTMEDAIETLLGKEIVDETDPVEDMRKLARKKRSRLMRKLGTKDSR